MGCPCNWIGDQVWDHLCNIPAHNFDNGDCAGNFRWPSLKIKLDNSTIHETTKYLIVGGNIRMTEVVDLEKSNSNSNFYGTLPLKKMGYDFGNGENGNVGAMLGGAPIICGGKYGLSDCLTFNRPYVKKSQNDGIAILDFRLIT